MVFGILNIVFGVLGLCGTFSSLSMFVVEDDGTNPVIPLMRESPLYLGFMYVSIPLGLLATAALLASGIALLNNKPWGRTLSIIYGWYAIIGAIVGAIINTAVLLPPALERSSGQMTPEDAGLIGGALAGTCGALIGLIYPILLLIFMNRQSVKNWFDPTKPQAIRDDAMAIEPWDA
jgi:hypothetical protein